MFLNRSVATAAMFLITLCSLGLLGACSARMRMSPIDENEQALINKALDASVGPSKDGRATMMSMFTPVLVYLPDMTCVAFKANRGTIGGEFTACFKKEDGSLALTHTEGV